MPVGETTPLVPPFTGNLFGSGFLSGLNTDAIQAAIEKYRAAQTANSASAATSPSPATPEGLFGNLLQTAQGGVTKPQTEASDLQARIQELIARAGGRGGMFPNIDLSQLQDQIAAFRAGQAAPEQPQMGVPEFQAPMIDREGIRARIMRMSR